MAVVVGGGIVLSGAVCAPVLALEVSARSTGELSGECFAMMLGSVFADASLPGVGRGIHAATEGWRCADMSPVSEDLRAIAECYAWRGVTDRGWSPALSLDARLPSPTVNRRPFVRFDMSGFAAAPLRTAAFV